MFGSMALSISEVAKQIGLRPSAIAITNSLGFFLRRIGSADEGATMSLCCIAWPWFAERGRLASRWRDQGPSLWFQYRNTAVSSLAETERAQDSRTRCFFAAHPVDASPRNATGQVPLQGTGGVPEENV